MSIVKYRPTREAMRSPVFPASGWEALDQWMNGMFSPSWGEPGRAPAPPPAFYPPVEITQRADEIVLRAELPGVKSEDVEITVHENALTLKGSKRTETHEPAEGDGGDYRYTERTFGEFLRTFTLPAAVDSTQVRAEFKEGILEIHMPMLEEAKPRKIKINGN